MAGEAILVELANSLIGRVIGLVEKEISLLLNVKDELRKLRSTGSRIQAVLHDADQQMQALNFQDQDFLQKLQEVKRVIEDLFEDFTTEANKRHTMRGNKVTKEVCLFFSSSNQLIYRHNLGVKLRDITNGLDHIAKEMENFALTTDPRSEIEHRTISSLPEVVIGREKDKKEIIDRLLGSEDEEKVIPIRGHGGMGKTTLAQMVFNDKKVEHNFDLRLWVYVPHKFDLKLIFQKILESITKEQKDLDPDNLRALIDENLKEKKYLLVLDDVWNEDQKTWDDLMGGLNCGKPGSKIILTTRLVKVAEFPRTKIHLLEGLSNSKSWELLKQFAFYRGKLPTNSSNIAQIGEEIANICVGVPLVIKAVGRHLYGKTIEEWLTFKETELPTIARDEESVIMTLKISYNHLPSHLRSCFAYCSLFPKGYKINVETLIQLWIAQNLVSFDGKQKPLEELEDVGRKIFTELCWRSFFEGVEKDTLGNPISCRMHDLMHDLAESVAGEEFLVLKSNDDNVTENTCHVSLDFNIDPSCQILSSLCNAAKLKTFLLLKQELASSSDVSDDSNFEVIYSNFERLRVLDLHDAGINRISSSIKKLKHLRYVDASGNNRIEFLPASMMNLTKLIGLKLSDCTMLKELPKYVTKLIHLRCLDCKGCWNLSHMPRGLGKLTSLQTLTWFVVAKDSINSKHVAGLEELAKLNKLRIVEIRNLRFVKNPKSAADAKLQDKQHLQSLTLSWNSEVEKDIDVYSDYDQRSSMNTRQGNMAAHDIDVDQQILESLKPNTKLKRLRVYEFSGARFPDWLSSIKYLVEVWIVNCAQLQYLPPLDQLPCLRDLWLSELTNLIYIDERERINSNVSFGSLKSLRIWCCPNLERWWKNLNDDCNLEDVIEQSVVELPVFQCLLKLDILSCPKISWSPFSFDDGVLEFDGEDLSRLQRTSPSGNVRFLNCLSSFSNLKTIEVCRCKGCRYFPPLNQIPPLEEIRLWDVEDLEYIGIENEGSNFFPSLEKLSINKCSSFKGWRNARNDYNEVSGLPQSSLDVTVVFPKLKELFLRRLDDLTHLGIEDSPLLESIRILYSRNLKSLIRNKGNKNTTTTSMSEFPEFPELTTLKIKDCPNFTFSAYNNTMKTLDLIAMSITNLKNLSLKDLSDLEFIDTKIFPLLKKLTIADCPNLKGLRNEGNEMLELHKFPTLRRLEIDNLPNFRFSVNGNTNLEKLALGNLPSLEFICIDTLPLLKNLKITRCPNLKGLRNEGNEMLELHPTLRKLEIDNLPNLEELALGNLPSLEFICIDTLPLLKYLEITRCPNLKGFEKLRSVPFSPLLVTLYWVDSNIEGLEKLINMASKLETLWIKNMRDVESLPSIQHLKSLKKLYIFDCEKLKSLPEGIKDVTSLEFLWVRRCPLLSERYREKDGVDWPSIAHIPRVNII